MAPIIRVLVLGAVVMTVVHLIRRVRRRPSLIPRPLPMPQNSAEPPAPTLASPTTPRRKGRRTILVAATVASLSLLAPWQFVVFGASPKGTAIVGLLLLFIWAYPVTRAWQSRPMIAPLAKACAVLSLIAGLLSVFVIRNDSFLFWGSTVGPGAWVYLACAVMLILGVARYTRNTQPITVSIAAQ